MTQFLHRQGSGLGFALYLSLFIFVGLPLATLGLWSVADGWLAPSLLPDAYTSAHWAAALEDGSIADAGAYSLLIAAIVTPLSAALAIPAAWALARCPFRWKRLVEIFILLPLIVPGMVVAISLARVFLTFDLGDSLPGVVLAQLIGTLPLTIRLLTASFETIPEELLLAARSLGASPPRMLFHVALPMAWPGLTASLVLCFVSSFEEFERTFIIGAPQIATLPLALYNSLQGQGALVPAGAVMAIILLIPVLIVFVIADRFARNNPLPMDMNRH